MTDPAAATATRPLRYVALGDSYTIGTAVSRPDESWPDQLVQRCRTASGQPLLELVANLGVNGFTSRDVIEHELPRVPALRPEFASILVGVNDVVQAVPIGTYEANAATILDALLEHLPPRRILAVSTPDYTVTPQGAGYGDPVERSHGIRLVNDVFARMAAEREIAMVDVHDLSLRAAADRSLVAGDGLHPSGAQYRLWVDRCAPTVIDLLRR